MRIHYLGETVAVFILSLKPHNMQANAHVCVIPKYPIIKPTCYTTEFLTRIGGYCTNLDFMDKPGKLLNKTQF